VVLGDALSAVLTVPALLLATLVATLLAALAGLLALLTGLLAAALLLAGLVWIALLILVRVLRILSHHLLPWGPPHNHNVTAAGNVPARDRDGRQADAT